MLMAPGLQSPTRTFREAAAMILRQGLAVFLSAFLASPLWANTAIVGTVQNSNLATLGGANLAAGTTLYDGDTVSVAPRGDAWINVPGGAAILVGQNSEIQLRKSTNGSVEFEIESGTAKFRSSATSAVDAVLADATIRALNDPAVGYIIMHGQDSAIIGAEKGDILVTTAHDDSSKTIHEGSAIAVRIVPDQSQNTDVIQPRKNRRRILFWGAVVVGSATAIGLLWPEGKESPSNF
jgi:hypothetical protein